MLLSKQHDLTADAYIIMRLSFRVLHSFPAKDTYLRVMGVGLMLDANRDISKIEVICQS